MNIVILDGRIATELKLLKTKTDKSFTSFTFAVPRFTGKKARESASQSGYQLTDFLRCIAFGKVAESACAYLKKGAHVIVEGSVHRDEYEQDGESKAMVRIKVNKLNFIAAPTGAEQPVKEKQPEMAKQYNDPYESLEADYSSEEFFADEDDDSFYN